MREPLVAGGFAVLLAACMAGPSTRVTPPAVPAPAGRSESSMPEASRRYLDSLATVRANENALKLSFESGEIDWFMAIGDSQLVKLVRTALENNRDLQTADARVREYRARLGSARAQRYPWLDMNMEWSTNKSVFGNSPSVQYDVVRAAPAVQWELDFWGRLRRNEQAARFDWSATVEDRRAIALTLVSDVATAYLDLLQIDESLRISNETLVSRETTLTLARRRFAQGVTSELDVRQFESQVAVTAASIAVFSRQRVEKANELSALIGKAPGAIAHGSELTTAVRALEVPDSVPAELIIRRPDVTRAQREWQGAIARVGVTVADRLPTFFISGEYGRQHTSLDSFFDHKNEVYSLRAQVSIPLFHGGDLTQQEKAARSRAEEARLQYDQTLLKALREASDALAGVRFTRDQIVAQQTQVEALRGAFLIARRRYEAGIASYLEVLGAQRDLFVAELALVQAEAEHLIGTVRLYKALGGGW